MTKFYKFNDELVSKVDWRIADQLNMLAWQKKGLQDGGINLIFRKCMFYGIVGALIITMLMAINSLYQAALLHKSNVDHSFPIPANLRDTYRVRSA